MQSRLIEALRKLSASLCEMTCPKPTCKLTQQRCNDTDNFRKHYTFHSIDYLGKLRATKNVVRGHVEPSAGVRLSIAVLVGFEISARDMRCVSVHSAAVRSGCHVATPNDFNSIAFGGACCHQGSLKVQIYSLLLCQNPFQRCRLLTPAMWRATSIGEMVCAAWQPTPVTRACPEKLVPV